MIKKSNKPYKVLDLFAGAGGFSYGFSLVLDEKGEKVFEIIKAVEIDPVACDTLREHLEKEQGKKGKIVFEGDLTNTEVKDKIIKDCQGVDIIIGGPPCQTFSLAGPSRSGKRDVREALKKDKRNILFKHYLDIVKELRPKFIVFENVEGITSKETQDISELSIKNKKVIELICEELESNEECKYSLKNDNIKDQKYLILNAANYGVPQERKRVFIIGNKMNMSNPYPEPRYGDDKSMAHVTVKEAIGDLPALLPVFTTRSIKMLKKIDFILNNYTKYLEKLLDNIRSLNKRWIFDENITDLENLIKQEISIYHKEKVTYEGILNFIKRANKSLKESSGIDRYFANSYNQEDNDFLDYVKGNSNKLTLHKSRSHNIRDIIIFMLMPAGTTSAHFFTENNNSYMTENLKEQLKELYPYDPSKHVDTYVKHSPDRPSKTILAHLAKDGLRFIHPEQPRTFTPREAARLQSFPDDFYFHGSMISQYRQIGNAVPPLLAKAIGEAIHDKLKAIKNNEGKEVVAGL